MNIKFEGKEIKNVYHYSKEEFILRLKEGNLTIKNKKIYKNSGAVVGFVIKN